MSVVARLALAVSLLLGPAARAEDSPPAEVAARRGDFFLQLRSCPRAILHYRKAIEADAAHARARLRLAFCLHAAGKSDDALVHLEKLVGDAPLGHDAWVAMIDLHLGRKALDKASDAAERAQKAGVTAPILLLRVGRIARLRSEAGGDTAAIEKEKALKTLLLLKKIVLPGTALGRELDKEIVAARYGALASALNAAKDALAGGNPDVALAKADELLAKEPAFAEALMVRGHALAAGKGNRVADAIESFKKAGTAPAFAAIAELEFERGDMEDAELTLRKALSLDDSLQEAHYQLGLIYRELGEYPKALASWRKAVAQDARSPVGERAATKLQVLTGEVRGLAEGEVLDPASERHLGQKFLEMIEKKWGRYEDEALDARLAAIAKRLVAVSDRSGLELRYEIRVTKKAGINAVTFPGGKILFFKGMIDFIKDQLGDQDDVYAAVLSHEIAHAALRHGVTKAKILSARASLSASFGAQSSIQSFLSGFSRANEFEADQFGALYMYRAGYNPAAMLKLHRRMLAQKEIPEGLGHPPHKQRIERLRGYLLDLRAKTRSFKVGLSAMKTRDYTRAIQHFEVFLGVFPSSAAARNNLALAMHKKALVRLPQNALRKAGDIDPDAKAPPILLRAAATVAKPADERGGGAAAAAAEVIIDKPLLREAVGELQIVLRHDQSYVRAHINLAAALMDLGQGKDSALRHLQTALRLDPENVHAQNNLAVAHLDAGETEQGVELLKKLAGAAAPYEGAVFNLAIALEKSGAKEGAKKAFAKYLELDKDSGWAKIASKKLAALE